MIPPKECQERRFLWVLLAAVYGLVNSNAKWQVQSDDVIRSIGLTQCIYIPQLFYKHRKKRLVLVVAKVVDELMIKGEKDEDDIFQRHFGEKFQLGHSATGPGTLQFFGLTVTQSPHMSSMISGDDNPDALEAYPLTFTRRRLQDDPMNEIERSSFMSLNSWIGWLGLTASPLCAFYESYLQ